MPVQLKKRIFTRSVPVYFAISLLITLSITSCKKEEPVNEQETSSSYSGHDAYVKGTITDSLTGDPITGYRIMVNGPQACADSVINGEYPPLLVHWFYSQYSYPRPSEVSINLSDSASGVVETLTFNGDLLIEDDTIIVDFQVTL